MWEQIRANQRKAFWLMACMALILFGIGYAGGEALTPNGGLIGLLIAAVIFFVQLGVYFAAGEAILMSGLGARELTREESPRLFNIVEEMQLASGLGFTPKIYLIDNDSPNAFAIGRKPEKSAVAVTRGLMYRLNRDELQGVIAHEIAHLKNLDTKFMTLAGVMMGSIIIMSDMAMRMFFHGNRGRTRSNSRGDGNAQAQIIMLVVALLLIIVGPILARLLYFALSRAREYLADASAAVYTRYPDGLASALMRISESDIPLGDVNRAVAPMFIVNPLAASGSSKSMFSTHPPLYERVRVLKSMGGSSYKDYEAAFKKVSGKSIIGDHTLQESKAQGIRQASDEGPIETREETKTTIHRLAGYAAITCQCGAKLNIPSTFPGDSVRCIRCGVANPVPPPEEWNNLVKQRNERKAPPIPPPLMGGPVHPMAVMDYSRKAPGAWESFPCSCGAVIQLSPSFSAPMIQCRQCQTRYRVHG